MGQRSVWNISEKPFVTGTLEQCQQSLRIFPLPLNVHLWIKSYLKTVVLRMIVLPVRSTTQCNFYPKYIMCTHFFNSDFQNYVLVIILKTRGEFKIAPTVHFPLFDNRFLSSQSTRFPQMLSQNMHIPMHSCLKEWNGKSDLHFSFVTAQRWTWPRSDPCLHPRFGATALANSTFPSSHLYRILVRRGLEVASLGCQDRAPQGYSWPDPAPPGASR